MKYIVMGMFIVMSGDMEMSKHIEIWTIMWICREIKRDRFLATKNVAFLSKICFQSGFEFITMVSYRFKIYLKQFLNYFFFRA